MAITFSETFLDQVRDRADIVQIIGRYTPLKKAGNTFKGLCPFPDHREKTPSFTVNSQKQVFYCFGCGRGGNVFKFLMLHDNMSFFEAVEALAKDAGLEVPREQASPAERRQAQLKDRALALNAEVATLYRAQLHGQAGGHARLYIEDRGMSQEIITAFKLGYAPDSWDFLSTHYQNNLEALEILETVGLIAPRKEGSGYYDLFRHKIIFPIHDVQERVVGFGSRRLAEGPDAGPKYVNSRESVVYSKQRNLYGLFQAKEAIREEGNIILVEGYFDLLSLYQAGFHNVVATLGTALTENHVHLMRKYSEHVTLLYDGDKAGIDAMIRGVDRMLPFDLRVEVVALPQGKDPDDFVRADGSKTLQELLAAPQQGLNFLLETILKRHPIKDAKGKLEAVSELAQFLPRIGSEIERREFLTQVGDRLGLDHRVLYAELRSLIKSGPSKPVFEAANWEASRRLEATLIYLMSHSTTVAEIASERLTAEAFSTSEYKTMARIVFDLIEQGKEPKIARLHDLYALAGVWEAFEFLEGQGLREFEVDHLEVIPAAYDAITNLEKRNAKKQLQKLQGDIAQAEKLGDRDKTRELIGQKMDLARQIHQWEGLLKEKDGKSS